MSALRIAAPAKINLHLRIVGKRADGHHEIETVFQKIDLCDEIEVARSDQDELILESCPWPIGPAEQNLAWRALMALRREAGRGFPPVRITVRKRIPPGAGLGGGSSDAAATLRGLNELFSLGIGPEDMRRVGLSLGADVPFLLSDAACAIGRGIGELLEPVEHRNSWPVAVLYPGHESSTAAAYAAFDREPHPPAPPPLVTLVEGLRAGDLDRVRTAVHSDFATILFRVHPRMAMASDWLRGQGCPTVWPTGSGSVMVALGPEVSTLSRHTLPEGFTLLDAFLLQSGAERCNLD
jgi:4-diphosphocytidyl-2-C-methyl-D-erythritol kinase